MKKTILLSFFTFCTLYAFAQCPDEKLYILQHEKSAVLPIEPQILPNGSFYYGFNYFGNFTFDGNTYTNARKEKKYQDFAVFKINRNGKMEWKHEANNQNKVQLTDAKQDKHNDLFALGLHDSADFIFGDKKLITGKKRGVFLSKITKEGTILWIKDVIKLPDSSANYVQSTAKLLIDDSSNIYIYGIFGGEIEVDKYNLRASNPVNMFLIKLDSNLNYQWSNTDIWSDFFFTTALDIDTKGNIYTLINFFNTAFAGKFIFDNKNDLGVGTDLLVSKFSPQGKLTWAKQLGSFGSDYSFSMTTDKNENVYLAGDFSGQFQSGQKQILGNYDGYAGFVAGLDKDGNTFLLNSINGSNTSSATYIKNWNDSFLYISGNFQRSLGYQNTDSVFTGTQLTEEAVNGYYLKIRLDGSPVYLKAIQSSENANAGLFPYAPNKLLITGQYENDLKAGGLSVSSMGEQNDFFFYTCDNFLSNKISPAEPSLEKLSIYPNPVKDNFKIELPLNTSNTQNVTIYLFDQLGRKVKTLQSDTIEITISTENLSHGMYFIRLNNGRFWYHGSFIKE